MAYPHKLKGFTLVELSIVLVIIGLLTGGILAGRAMVASARTEMAVKQLQQLDVAIGSFYSIYDGFPGDTMRLYNPGKNGNENGIVDTGGEMPFVWNDLSIGVDLKNKFNNDFSIMPGVNLADVSGQPEGTYTPVLDVRKNTINVPLLRLGAGIAASGWDSSRNYYQYMMPGNPANAGWQTADVMRPADTMKLDSKIDDGFPNEGNFRAREYQTSTAQNRCVSGTSYNNSETGFYCSWELLVGISTGMEKKR